MDDFSKNIHKQYLEKYPEWSSHITCLDDAFEAKIPRPNDSNPPMMELEAFGDELTVFFGPYHAHFDDYGDNDAFNDAFDFVNQITSGDYAIVSYWRGEKWCASSIVDINTLPTGNKEYPYADTIKILTWTGDKDGHVKCRANC